VLLHGFGGDARTWAALATLLSQRGIDVAAPDLPGHGATKIEADSLAALAASLAAALDGTTPLELVGHSLGGAVAVMLARALPHRVARVTLIAPAGLDSAIDADFVAGLAATTTPGGLSHLLRRLSPRPPLVSPAQLAVMAAEMARGRLTALAETLAGGGRQQIDILPDLAALPMPVRVVWGLDDRIIPWTQVTRLPSRVAVHLVAGAGHMPHWDMPHQIAALFDA
jgi:pyruvate dehydrogenase E2 component (dihydrolipoamide acetyltransferase)